MNLYFKIISNEKKGLLFDCIRGFLWLASLGYGALVRLRPRAKPVRTGLPTISIGNIVAGGTGKTPFTILLARMLQNEGKIAILLRGYKGKMEHGGGTRVSACDPELFGDEAALLKRKLPEAVIYVGKRRDESAEKAAKEGARLILLDDGFQHRSFHRDLDIVLLDARNPFGYGALLPRGLLREPLSALSRADMIVLNRVDESSNLDATIQEIQKFSKAPLIKTRVVADGFASLDGKARALEPCCVALFSAIGAPATFHHLVCSLGFRVVDHLILPDHAAISQKTLSRYWERAQQKGAVGLLCTEKDAVKLASRLPIYSVNMKLEVVEGSTILDKALRKALSS
jgi:tetraacyldisaccharide 4'-kinase